jgi:4-amino-4-deoxy-L-arabinose transferase-like glycosyltransferase
MTNLVYRLAALLRRFTNWRGFKWLMFGLLALALVARLSFLCIGFSPETNDPQSFYHNAVSLAETGELDDSGWWDRGYLAKFPYLINYIWLLALFMRIFGSGTLAIISLNTLFCVAGAGLLYLLFSRVAGRRVGLFAAVLWFINPVEIVFAALPLPTVVVNFFIIAAITTAYFLLRSRTHLKPLLQYSLLLGLVLGLANLFRPFMTVFLIALALVFALILIRQFRPRRLPAFVGSLALIWAVMTGVQTVALLPAERVIGYDNLDYFSGWSLLLGSNYQHHGTWNEDDNAFQAAVRAETGDDWTEFDRRLRASALDRYREFSVADFFRHWWNKARVILAGPGSSLQFELWNYRGIGRGAYFVLAHIYLALLFLLLLLGLARLVVLRRLPFTVLFTLLAAAGIFAAHVLLTEVMDRYSIPLIPLFLIVGLWGVFLTAKSVARPRP